MVDVPVYQSIYSPGQNASPTYYGSGSYLNATPFYGPSASQSSSNGGNTSSSGGLSNLLQYIPTDLTGKGSSIFSGIGQSVNQFGTNLGFSAGNVGAIAEGGATEAISPALASADPSLLASGAGAVDGALSASSLTGVLGAAGLGALAGGFLNSGNPMAGQIGGGLGAGIGMALGGPIGAVAGTLIGGLGSRLFGNKSKPTEASNFRAYTGEGTGFQSVGYAEKNAQGYSGFNKYLSSQVEGAIKSASTYLGVKFPDLNVIGGISTEHGGANLTVNNDPRKINDIYSFDPNNQGSFNTALDGVLTSLAKNSGVEQSKITDMLDNLNRQGKYASTGIAGTQIPYTAPAPATQTQSFQQFLTNYQSQQNANAA